MKLTEKIHLLRIDFEIVISPEKRLKRFVNVIIIFGDQIVLIDTGVKGSWDKISGYLLENGRHYSEIGTIILSHSHPDHIGEATRIQELTGCRILAHPAEREWIENIEIQNSERAVPGFFSLVDQSVKIDGFLSDGQILKMSEDITARIIHSPGHSAGSLNLLFIEDRILFTADSIPLKNDIPNYDNYPDLTKSLAKIRSNSEYTTLLTSWTAPLADKEEIEKIITEGEEYIRKINSAVMEVYPDRESATIDHCRVTIEKLGLPLFLANNVVNRAFLSHIE